MNRRTLFTGAIGMALATTAKAADVSHIPIIDTHFHIFDATRPQGAPYTGSKDYKGGVALPATYRKEFERLGVVGAIELEASPWIEDNLWVLEQLQANDLCVGTVGNLEPEKPEFAEYLDRYRKNPLFLGIRCGNIWNRDVAKMADNPSFIEGLKRLAQADLVMDTANPNVALLKAMLKISDKVPDLRIVLDHLPSFVPVASESKDYDMVLKEMHDRPMIHAKLSEILYRGSPHDMSAHKARLDRFMDVFGEDRVMFGSDWPESVGAATPTEIVSFARQYFATRSRSEAEKFFWKNSLKIYKWKKRTDSQPG